MLVAVCSAKGSPGATSTALAIATVCQRESPALLLEADPSGSDLSFRVKQSGGNAIAVSPNITTLAAAVRGERPDARATIGSATSWFQELESGVGLVPGVQTPAQGRSLASLWPAIARTCRGPALQGYDVIIDLGRVDSTAASLALAAAADAVLVIFSATVESVLHARETMRELGAALNRDRLVTLIPVLIGEARHDAADLADADQIFGVYGLPVTRSRHVAWDPKGLRRVEDNQSTGGGRFGRSPLLTSVTTLIDELRSAVEVSAPGSAERAVSMPDTAVPQVKSGIESWLARGSSR